MPMIDWTETSKPAGVYHAEVSSSVEMCGRESGQPYFFVTFLDVADKGKICHDIVSFSPQAMNMSTAKLRALGFDEEKKEIHAGELVGRRVWIAVMMEHNDGYQPRLAIDITAKNGFRCGYKSEHVQMHPVGPEPSKENLDDDIPF